ncbi:uncharacterized protein KY384_008031 [Bacidia gigantensis]|uniref:uncharacterized protein n=1 Tax=Bacidia gigantensis TaxID=2732470 RepID=UPI001D052F63|nr:uncharacterized protein KY384_008031 [Bacidia gigantensis]KAG8527287.1 hypothetical protein KY384_008031 [Bacidia gigantensis]
MRNLQLTLLALLPAALAKTIDIDVGSGGLNFAPDTVTAAKGDVLAFHFYPPEHNVAQSTFDKPCVPSAGGIFSGTVEVKGTESDQTFNVVVNDTNPIWLYCGYEGHCNRGMAMVVNAP